MKIILSPAKKMNVDTDSMPCLSTPVYLSKTQRILEWLKGQTYRELKVLWQCNEEIARQNYERILHMDLKRLCTPAILSYEGIAYQYMAPGVFSDVQWDYVQKHLRILSGFYGILKPQDGVVPYRLEMQAKADIDGTKNLYGFWGRSLYDNLTADEDSKAFVIINLASAEYAKCIEKYLDDNVRYVTVIFGEIVNGKVVQKGTLAKMARGEMVRYMSTHNITEPEAMKDFRALDFVYDAECSQENKMVFIRRFI